MSIKNCVFAVALAAVSGTAAADLGFEYRVNRVADKIEDCEPIAVRVAAQFTRATGRAVISSTCDAYVPWQQDVLIHYAGETRLPVVSTWDEWAHRQGMYQTYAQCAADLANESATFQRLTGLTPVVAYCYSESSLSETPNRWVSRVDGLGISPMQAFTIEQSIYGVPIQSLDDIADSVARSVETFGLRETRLIADSDGYSARITLRFYAPRRPPLNIVRYTSYVNPSACLAGVSELSDVLEAAGGTLIDSFCVRKDFSEVTELYSLVHVRGPFERRMIEGRYASMQSCRADRERLIRVLRESQGLDPAGAICDYHQGEIIEPDGFAMQVYIRN